MDSGFTKRPICPFCNAEWTDDMVRLFDVSSVGGCDSCGHGASKSGTIDITCESCERLIYRKEFRGLD